MSSLTRRRLLQGLGAGLALPLLEATSPRRALAADGAPPQRLVVCFVPNGWQSVLWTGTGTGADYTLGPSMAALAPIRDRCLVVGGLDNRPSIHPTRQDEHGACTASILTASHYKGESGLARNAGWSLDQIIADAIGADTVFPSIALGSEEPLRCYVPDLCPHFLNISWRGHEAPVDKVIHPQSAYARIFGGVDPSLPDAERAARLRMDQRLLDTVRSHTKRYEGALGAADQRRIDAYLDGLSELERRIAADAGARSCGTGFEAPRRDPFDPTQELRAMADLVALTLQCDRTRVVTWMLGTGRSERHFDFMGVPVNHHDLSHEPSWIDAHVAVDSWYLSQFVHLVQRLDAIEEVDGSTMLDNTLVLYVSGMANGATHDPYGLELILAGRGNSSLPFGQRVQAPPETPVANLWLSVLDRFGVRQRKFGDDGTQSLLDLSV